MTPIPEEARPVPTGRRTLDPRFRLLLVLGGILAALDQATKWAVVWYYDGLQGSRQVIIDGSFDLILTRNPGAAFSLFADLEPDWLRIAMFILLSTFAIAFIFYYASKATAEQRLFLWGLGFVFGGAVGNLIDRVYAGSVVDFIEVYSHAPWLVDALDCRPSWGCRFPAFNVADISINVGVGLLLLDAVRTTLHERRAAKRAAAAGPPDDAAQVPLPAEPAATPADAPISLDAPPPANPPTDGA